MGGFRIAVGDLAANVAAVTGPLELLVWVAVIVIVVALVIAVIRRM